eukprot:TRINITY_DN2085_c0_g1_i4.p1 TRINITY_DN2085_c0_g1~~TRINITY_DN2085_c0_g1_i4.p1  ORF type:complete len:176 (+),score=39.47 TRINITY_DN2085_c0_g1_i4:367-894(+)
MDEQLREATEYVRLADKDVSFVVLNEQTGRLVAFALATNWADEIRSSSHLVPGERSKFSDRYQELNVLMAQLADVFLHDNIKTAHSGFSGVVPELSGRGFGTFLKRKVFEAAKAKGYKRVFGDPSSPAMQHICAKTAVLRNEISLKTWKCPLHENCFPFQDYTTTKCVQLYEWMV